MTLMIHPMPVLVDLLRRTPSQMILAVDAPAAGTGPWKNLLVQQVMAHKKMKMTEGLAAVIQSLQTTETKYVRLSNCKMFFKTFHGLEYCRPEHI